MYSFQLQKADPQPANVVAGRVAWRTSDAVRSELIGENAGSKIVRVGITGIYSSVYSASTQCSLYSQMNKSPGYN